MEDRTLGASPGSKSDLSILTYVQAHDLLKALDNTKLVLENYVQLLEDSPDVRVRKHQKSWWGRNCCPDKRRILYKYVTMITLSLQLLNLLVLTVIDAWPRHDSGEHQFLLASSCTMIILQFLNLILLIGASGRLVKQIYKHSVNNLFLAQAYLATILLFAGIYTTTYRLRKRSWRMVDEDMSEDPSQVFVVYAKFLFYSISTATLCGSSNLTAIEWYNCLFAGIQMLTSFCYFSSILGIVMSPDKTSLFKSIGPRKSHLNHKTTKTGILDDIIPSRFCSWNVNQTDSLTSYSTSGSGESHINQMNRSVLCDMPSIDCEVRRDVTLSAVMDITGKDSPQQSHYLDINGKDTQQQSRYADVDTTSKLREETACESIYICSRDTYSSIQKLV